ncbi:MAG TPA: isochorismatase family protein, partial [Myxococcaceae bacterium]|nr:isochorismatase family protein [Myxococcaceae bacterium]
MAEASFRLDGTGLLIVDPYNDFISDGGKLWPRVREVAEANGCVRHMSEILEAARTAGIRVFFSPHHRWRPGDYETWKYWAPIQQGAARSKVFAEGTWGGTFREELTPQAGEV